MQHSKTVQKHCTGLRQKYLAAAKTKLQRLGWLWKPIRREPLFPPQLAYEPVGDLTTSACLAAFSFFQAGDRTTELHKYTHTPLLGKQEAVHQAGMGLQLAAAAAIAPNSGSLPSKRGIRVTGQSRMITVFIEEYIAQTAMPPPFLLLRTIQTRPFPLLWPAQNHYN